MKYQSRGKIFEIESVYNTDNNYYELRIKDNENKQVGYLNFMVNSNIRNKIYLNKILVDEECLGQGYGTALIKAFEYLAIKLRADSVEGKYFPTNDRTKPFYIANGYSIEKDGYETFVSKYIDRDEVKQNIEPNITEFEIIEESSNQNDGMDI